MFTFIFFPSFVVGTDCYGGARVGIHIVFICGLTKALRRRRRRASFVI